MKTLIELTSLGLFAFLFALLCIPVLKKVAIKTNLVDKPNHRKVHTNTIPLIGGISIVFTTTAVLFFSGNLMDLLKHFMPIVSCGFVLLIVGVIDDKNDIKAKYKLILQLLLSFIIAFSGIRITSFYGVFGIQEIALWIQYLLTILVITGVVNAFNLMDGVDGLAGGLSLCGFIMFFMVAFHFKNYFLAKLSIVFVGAIIGFLKFNLSRNKIFMGDSGSLFLGFVLVTLGIQFLQEQMVSKDFDYAYDFTFLVAFFSIPVLDSIRVYLGRIKHGDSPFKADKSHLHHLLLSTGLAHKKISLVIVCFCVLLFFIGFSLTSFVSTTFVLMVIIFAFWSIVKLLLMINSLQEWKTIIKTLEDA